MSICVEIEIDDAGQVTVGVCPPGEESGEPKDYMQPASDVAAALETARGLLGGQGEQKPAMPAAKPATMKEAMFGPDKPDAQA